LRPNNDAQKQRKRLSRFITHPKLKIVSVSNHTKNSVLINFPNIRDEQIHVLYCPYPNLSENLLLQNQEAAILKANHLEKDNYFLILSAGRWFKNAYRAIKAFDHLAGINNLYGKKVVVLGVTDKSYLARQIRHRKSFIFKRFAETEELQQLYKNAYSLVYPSLQEGFGIPPVEAMRYGTPVLAASTASIPEICQQGACYFNPHSIMEIENRILYLLTDKLFHSQCRKNSFERKREIGIRQKEDLDKLIELILD
jgi:glycosyltransferase involved in cell wall biosynthesis